MMLPILFLIARISPETAGVAYKQPQLAAGNGQVGVAFGAGNAIYYADSKDGGRTFGAPVVVSEVGSLALRRHRGPRIAILKDAIVVSAIAGDAGKEASELLVWRSTDHGRTWKRGGVVNDVPAAAREGLHTMTADAKGRLFAAWLDLRGDGTRLYGSRSDDGGLTWSKNALIYESPDGTICQCCHPTAVAGDDGKVWTMWRNALQGSRDFYVASSADGVHFDAAHKLGTGTWKLAACPMDGGGFAVSKGEVFSAWRRDDTVFVAENDKSERAVGKGKDVALANGKRGLVVAWAKGEGLEVLPAGAEKPEQLSERGAFVNLLALPDGAVLAAWESGNEIQFRRVEP